MAPDPKLTNPVPVLVELSPDLVDALDVWIVSQPSPRPMRGEAVAYAIRDWLTSMGLLPFHDDPEMAN